MKRLLAPPGQNKWADVFAKMDSDPRDHNIKEEEFVHYYMEMLAASEGENATAK